MRGVLRFALLALPLALLSGCATRPEITPTADAAQVNAAWAARQQALGALQGFELNGRIAVKGGGLSGGLRWQQTGETFDLRIAGPFGAGALSMQGTAGQLHIKGKEIDLVTQEPEQVLAARTGWRLPLHALRWWVLGLPAPTLDEASVVLDAEGRALAIEQAGWTLRYSGYQPGTTAIAMPLRVEASQITPGGEWMATLAIEAIRLTP